MYYMYAFEGLKNYMQRIEKIYKIKTNKRIEN
jgi:hypothetical protein